MWRILSALIQAAAWPNYATTEDIGNNLFIIKNNEDLTGYVANHFVRKNAANENKPANYFDVFSGADAVRFARGKYHNVTISEDKEIQLFNKNMTIVFNYRLANDNQIITKMHINGEWARTG